LQTATSLWKTNVEALYDRLAGTDPTPAGVSLAAISAGLALGLLQKVLRIAGQRKDFRGDRERVSQLIVAAQEEAARLARYADQDIAAFNEYMASRRNGLREEPSLRSAIEVPLNIARSAATGLDLCAEAKNIAHAFVAPDLGAATELLRAAVRAPLLSVEFNLSQLPSDTQFYKDVVAEKDRLKIAS
jgi:formiminotetrahydrofolate cyclodeaminase